MATHPLHAVEAGPEASAASGVSWGAIFAGAFAAAALSFILVMLGFGLGFSSISPWSGEGLSAKAIGYSTAGWLVFTQIAAAAVGGFLAGRLRVKWAGVHTREVYFRDTAHGFLAWSVASLATAALLGTAVGTVISGGARTLGVAGSALGMTAAAAGAGAAQNPGEAVNLADRMSGYFIDTLFRGSTGAPAAASSTPANPAAPAPAAESAPLAVPGPANATPPESDVSPAQRLEVTRIFAYSLRSGSLAAADKTYIGQIVARRTGMGQADAEKRVADVYASYQRAIDEAGAKAKQAADATRKAAAYGAMWMFLSLLCGAFIASLFATFGGRMRDRVELFGDGPVRRRENLADTNLNA
ncbi:hypothetical protein J8I26_07960 [Herbaspirillum sp. LeCh32-8]|uniref:hypothetical protein n=1 Tax=Herbaspirillum sp. LeCh32-8 TaxID=2821356 RepID=UPI001AE503FE|nr:hypothetical protein [Herbaspirillum sp. LeCh32-8]MBP0598030.1 hypothetical protein [Herbaspirillum sp. LeCh32-8]